MPDTDIRELVESKTADIEGLLSGSGLTVERFKATVFQLWDQDYDLRKCTPNSILSGVMAVADVGLTFTKTLGHAYLVKYGNSAVPIIGARGLSHLAFKSGAALDIRTGIRREGEVFRYRPLHPTEPIIHEPLASYDEDGNYVGDAPDSRAKAIGYYAVAFLPGGLVRAEYMDIAAVERHRDKYSKAAKNGPWVTDFDEMAKKTLVRRLCKYMRLSGALEKAVHISDSIDATLNPSELAPDDLPKPKSVEVVRDVDGAGRVEVSHAGSERASTGRASPPDASAAPRAGGAEQVSAKGAGNSQQAGNAAQRSLLAETDAVCTAQDKAQIRAFCDEHKIKDGVFSQALFDYAAVDDVLELKASQLPGLLAHLEKFA